MIPSWILDIFAAIMLVVAAVSAARLVAARPWQHRTRPASACPYRTPRAPWSWPS